MNSQRPSPSPVPILPERLDWPSTIGNFLLNYGTLDYFVFCFLKDHLPVEDFTKVKECPFKERVRRIGQFMQEANLPDEQQKAFAQLVARLEPIRELRNHIAHGHMYVRIDEETHNPTVTVFRAKDLDMGFLPDAKHVEFQELLAALKSLSELIVGFQSLAGFVDQKHTSA